MEAAPVDVSAHRAVAYQDLAAAHFGGHVALRLGDRGLLCGTGWSTVTDKRIRFTELACVFDRHPFRGGRLS